MVFPNRKGQTWKVRSFLTLRLRSLTPSRFLITLVCFVLFIQSERNSNLLLPHLTRPQHAGTPNILRKYKQSLQWNVLKWLDIYLYNTKKTCVDCNTILLVCKMYFCIFHYRSKSSTGHLTTKIALDIYSICVNPSVCGVCVCTRLTCLCIQTTELDEPGAQSVLGPRRHDVLRREIQAAGKHCRFSQYIETVCVFNGIPACFHHFLGYVSLDKSISWMYKKRRLLK